MPSLAPPPSAGIRPGATTQRPSPGSSEHGTPSGGAPAAVGWFRLAGGAAVALVVAAGVVLRFVTTSDLWFDEAQTVAIARLPLGDLVDALAADGHPPLYYLLLHGWMAAVGEGDLAVRALSGLLSVAALPLAWVAGHRLGGRPAAVAALLVLASSPFALRYATESRMYALVILLVLAGHLAVGSALARPSPLRLAAVAVAGGLLLLTHYWAFFLLGALGLVLLVTAWRGSREARPARLRVAGALTASGLLFVPWLPTFLDQSATTGTPWGRPARPAEVLTSGLIDMGGGDYGEARLLGGLLALLAALALVGRATGDGVELDLATRPRPRWEAAVLLLTVGTGAVVSLGINAATAARYLSVVFPLVVLLAGLGVAALGSARARAAVLSVLVVLGAVGAVQNVRLDRTQGGQIAAAIEQAGSPGEVVAYCPDQLGVSTTRYLGDGYQEGTFPRFGSPERVDWRGYVRRQREVAPATFADSLVERAGPTRTVWLAWAGGHRPLGRRCEELAAALAARRPQTVVVDDQDEYEHGWLFRYDPA